MISVITITISIILGLLVLGLGCVTNNKWCVLQSLGHFGLAVIELLPKDQYYTFEAGLNGYSIRAGTSSIDAYTGLMIVGMLWICVCVVVSIFYVLRSKNHG